MASLISDKDIENLQRVKQVLSEIKQVLKEIREIDNNFSLSNVIEADEDTVLIFNCECFYKEDHLEEIRRYLTNMLKHKCVILNNGLTLDKAIAADYAKGRDYTTITYYDESGNPTKEETIQYK